MIHRVTELVPNIQLRIHDVIFVARLQEVDNDKSCARPVGSDKYLVFNLHQHPSHTAHVQ